VNDAEEIGALLEALGETAARLQALARVPEERWRRRPADGGWSAAQTLAHLRAGDDIVAPRLLQVLVRDEPPLPAFDERRWQDTAAYDTWPPRELIAAFAARRAELVAALRRRPAVDWERAGLHETAGRQTLREIARALVAHEREHLETIPRLLAPFA
jgi:uncharacterized damage-inducible protein DinB